MKFYKFIIFFLIIPSFLFAKIDRFDTLANDNKCLTFHIENTGNKLLKTFTFDTTTKRPKNHKAFPSLTGMFLIHYDTSGVHSVDLTDSNHNGVPDYVDSITYYCEYVYQKEVVEMGFHSPIGDSLRGGSNAFDIYLLNIGDRDLYPDIDGGQDHGGAYGFTVPEFDIPSQVGFPKSISYIVIDNDFSPRDSMLLPDKRLVQSFKVFGYDGAKVTLAHEFHHAIQMRYGLDNYTGSIIAEMSSVMMEMVLYPEIMDYMQYVRSLFKNPSNYPFCTPSPQVGYRYGIFTYFIQKKYGVDAVKKIWEIIETGIPTYKAIQYALEYYNSSLITEWKAFTRSLYFTNSRGNQNQYFENANEMPEFSFKNDQIFTVPSASYSGKLLQFEIRMDRTIVNNPLPLSNDTLIAIESSYDTLALFSQNTYGDDFNAAVCIDNLQNSVPIFVNSPRKKYFQLSSAHNSVQAELIEFVGEETFAIDYAFPSPFRYNTDDAIYFPAPENIEIGKKVNLRIYNSALKEIFNDQVPISSQGKNRIISLDLKNNAYQNIYFESGIYIFEIEADGQRKVGKIAVVK